MEEGFRTLDAYPNYQVSNLGRVKSLGRQVVIRHGVRIPTKQRILTPTLRDSGFNTVTLSPKKNEQCVCHLHKLVAMAFLNYNPDHKSDAPVHIDGNKLNNNLSNIKVVSRLPTTTH